MEIAPRHNHHHVPQKSYILTVETENEKDCKHVEFADGHEYLMAVKNSKFCIKAHNVTHRYCDVHIWICNGLDHHYRIPAMSTIVISHDKETKAQLVFDSRFHHISNGPQQKYPVESDIENCFLSNISAVFVPLRSERVKITIPVVICDHRLA